ncbi:GGDEF domain-containing protein [Shewanella sp. HL-SH5]|uniref:GGDEF domain-containing protein n=1 Tax=Shewanella sp. HL-SH5 TaxID=3436241 RepID=UPI003EBC036D
MEYKTQHTIILLYVLAFIYKITIYTFAWPADLIEFVAEIAMLIACFAVMYYINPLKVFPKIYWLMLFGSAFYSMSAFMDLTEEFFVESTVRNSNLDDFLKTSGFILLSLGIHRWMNLHLQLISELKRKAETDQLTGLLNRRAFIQRITGIFKPKESEGRAFLLLDIDHFKAINDNYGHACGDQVLTAAAKSLKSQVRKDDILARWGGEEFLFFLANVTKDEAIAIANSLRQHIAQLTFECNNEAIQCTTSIGIYHAFSSSGLEKEIDSADQALYKAKSNGRNCVVLYE